MVPKNRQYITVHIYNNESKWMNVSDMWIAFQYVDSWIMFLKETRARVCENYFTAEWVQNIFKAIKMVKDLTLVVKNSQTKQWDH